MPTLFILYNPVARNSAHGLMPIAPSVLCNALEQSSHCTTWQWRTTIHRGLPWVRHFQHVFRRTSLEVRLVVGNDWNLVGEGALALLQHFPQHFRYLA